MEQLDIFAVPTAPAARGSDPDTSHAAALRNLQGRGTDRKLALAALVRDRAGLTDFELGDVIGRAQTSAGKRRGELRDMGLVEPTDERRPAPSGSMAIVWKVNQHGLRVFQMLEGG